MTDNAIETTLDTVRILILPRAQNFVRPTAVLFTAGSLSGAGTGGFPSSTRNTNLDRHTVMFCNQILLRAEDVFCD